MYSINKPALSISHLLGLVCFTFSEFDAFFSKQSAHLPKRSEAVSDQAFIHSGLLTANLHMYANHLYLWIWLHQRGILYLLSIIAMFLQPSTLICSNSDGQTVLFCCATVHISILLHTSMLLYFCIFLLTPMKILIMMCSNNIWSLICNLNSRSLLSRVLFIRTGLTFFC